MGFDGTQSMKQAAAIDEAPGQIQLGPSPGVDR